MNNEKELLKLLENDIDQAFPDLINRYEKALMNFAYRMTGDMQGAQDIVQEVFFKFYIKFFEMLPIDYLTALLYRMTGNLSKNYIRDRFRKKEIALKVDSSTTGFSLPVAADNTKSDIDDLKEIVFTALSKIPERQKTAFVLKVFEDRNYEEIADVLETSRNNVMVLIHRAHTSLATDKSLLEYMGLEE